MGHAPCAGTRRLRARRGSTGAGCLPNAAARAAGGAWRNQSGWRELQRRRSPAGDAGAWGGRHGAADRAGLAATPTVARTLPERVAAGRLAGERLWRRLASGAIHSPAPAVGAARRAGPLPHVPSGGPPAALQLSDREHPHRAAGAQGTMDLRRRHSVRPTVPLAVRGPRRGALPPTLRPGAGPVSPRARSSPAAG